MIDGQECRTEERLETIEIIVRQRVRGMTSSRIGGSDDGIVRRGQREKIGQFFQLMILGKVRLELKRRLIAEEHNRFPSDEIRIERMLISIRHGTGRVE